MNISPKAILKQILDFWKSQTKKMKIIIIASAVGIVVIAATVSIIINTTNYAILYSGLSDAEGAEIMARLDKLSVDSKIQGNGTILVPREQVDKLKMQLSGEGYPKSSLSYDIFKNNISFTSTDFEKKQYLVFQLQERLQDSIKTIKGIKNAIVTISLTEDSNFVLDEDKIPTTASVVIDLEPGITLTAQQVKSIENLVAKSIPGLENKNVSITDTNATALNGTDSTTDGTNMTKIELEKKASDLLKSKIIDLLKPVFGKNGLSVGVNVKIDFQKITKETTNYSAVNGDKGIVSKEEKSLDTNATTTATGTPGVDTNAENTNNNGTGNNGNVISSTSSVDYLVNKIIEQIQQDGGAIKDATAAVMIDKKGLSDDEKNNIKDMVAYAVGISTDKVVVTDFEFTAARKQAADAELAQNTKTTPLLSSKLLYVAIPVLALLLILAVLMIIFSRKRKKAMEEAGIEDNKKLPKIAEDHNKQEDVAVGAIVLNETREQALKKEIKDFSAANPDIVAQLLRTWIKDEND